MRRWKLMLPTIYETHGAGHRLRVARLGRGEPLVLLHGYPDNLQIWSRIAPLLAKRFEVIAFDWPGLGYSDLWRGGATPLHMAGRLLALLDKWKIGQASIMAMDMGGQAALAFAAQHPARMRRLIVMNSLVLGDEATSWEIRVLRRFGWNRLLLGRQPRAVFQRALCTFLPRGERLSAEVRDDLWRSFQQPEVRSFVIRMCAGYSAQLPRLPELYRSIACPTLILWGECDRHFPLRQGERLHALISGSQFQVIPGGEHWMAWHEAEAVAKHIVDFS
jgi:pimeloyl-ACP methyl ester carboxylesterase